MLNYPLRSIVAAVSILLCPYAFSDQLILYFIDVEQADSTLIISPSKNTLLIDSGKNRMGSRIKKVMDDAGVNAIDHFVATHYHEDHYGGIDDLVSLDIPVHNSYDRGDKQFLPDSRTTQATYIDYLNAVGNNAVHIMRGETIDFDDNIQVTTISSGGVVLKEQPPHPGEEENDMSLSFLINFHGFKFFIGGDIGEPIEEKIAELDLVRDVDMYQSNHHGSHTSSSIDFMNDLKPSIVIISNGSTRKYQHPRKTTLTTYNELSPTPLVLQTNKYMSGGSKFDNVNDEFIADIPPNDKNGTIKVVVDSVTRMITITYRDQTHTIPIKNKPSSSSTVLVIKSLLPDPHGSDRKNETVTLVNKGTKTENLSDYMLIDKSERVWMLEGSLEPGQSIDVVRDGMPMSLNNNGDTIRIITDEGLEIDRFTYSSSSPGEVINTGH